MRFVLMCLLVVGAGGLVAAQEPVNLVANPGFEQLTAAGSPRDWTGGEFGLPGENLVVDRAVAHAGRNSLRLGVSPNSFVTSQAAAITVKPETTYCVAWWCKTDGLRQARAYLWLQSNEAQRVLEGADQVGTRGWTLHLAEYRTTATETTLAPVPTTHDLGGGPCFAWFDDIGLYKGGFPRQYRAEYAALKRQAGGLADTAAVLATTPSLTLWADNLAARIYPEGGVPEAAPAAEAVDLAAACNEEAFCQLVVTPARRTRGVTVEPSDLQGPGTIPASAIRWWPVGYANVKTANDPKTRLGPTPDPLLDPRPVVAPAGRNTVFCLGIRTPPDARPGLYRGEVVVRAGTRELARARLRLRVYDFALPADPTFRTLITFSPASFAPWDKRPVAEIHRDICRVLHEHGIRGDGTAVEVPARLVDGRVVCDFASFDEHIAWTIENLRFNAFFLGPMFGGGTGEAWEKHRQWLGMNPLEGDFNRLFGDYLRQVAAHLREKGWLDMSYLYLWDEPEPDYFDKVVALQQVALAADPGFKIWETTSPSHEAFWGTVKAWSVPFSRPHFDEEAVAARRRQGEEIWVYNIPATLEAPPQVHRLWFWQAAKYDTVGAQLWQTSFYHGIDPWETITPEPYPVGRDGTQWYRYDAGQAILLYPNPSLREDPPVPGPPIPCLRLKLLQKGLDDFEYLHLLRERLTKQARARSLADPEAYAQTEMQRLAGQIVLDINRYNADLRKLEQVRAEVARRIERLGG